MGYMRCLLLILGLYLAGPVPSPGTDRSWWLSVAALGASSALDGATSWSRPEVNPVLAGPDGRFGARGLVIKAGITAGVVLVEWSIVRSRPGSKRAFIITNLAAAGAYAYAGARNVAYRLRGR